MPIMNYESETIVKQINKLKGDRKSKDFISNARIARFLGVDERTVKNWLGQGVTIPFKHIVGLSNFFGCSIEFFLDESMPELQYQIVQEIV